MFDYLIIFLLLPIFISTFRLIKGPTLADRIVALDVLSIMGISYLVVLSLYFQRIIYIDIALVLGLIGFLSTTIFGRYIEKGI
jgi:multicomponent Na+:H+ antiporter subunit F